MQCIHSNNEKNHRWAEYDSLDSMDRIQRKKNPRIINCPVCHKRGRVNHYFVDKSRTDLVSYYVIHQEDRRNMGQRRKQSKTATLLYRKARTQREHDPKETREIHTEMTKLEGITCPICGQLRCFHRCDHCSEKFVWTDKYGVKHINPKSGKTIPFDEYGNEHNKCMLGGTRDGRYRNEEQRLQQVYSTEKFNDLH